MTLAERHPREFQDWVKAGYQDEALRDHLIGIGVLLATEEDLFRLTQKFLNQVKGIVLNLKAQR